MTLFISLAFSGCSNEPVGDILQFKMVDPLEKVFKETAFFNEAGPVADVAAGEHASFQFAVRGQENIKRLRLSVVSLKSGENALTDFKTGYVGYIRVGRNNPAPSRDKLIPVSGFYPDPIIEKESVDLPANETLPVWLTVAIPIDAVPGFYEGEVL
ncbi:MAG TPA: hypothetical protein VI583_05135, partial [Cyclobacteriaceae bacterium]|nr:hypothetical protein [Cyclobacteriaceae bacterium]